MVQNEVKQTLASKVIQLESHLNALQMTNQQTAVSGLEGDQLVAATDGLPTSCKDLRLLAHVVNGLFSVIGTPTSIRPILRLFPVGLNSLTTKKR